MTCTKWFNCRCHVDAVFNVITYNYIIAGCSVILLSLSVSELQTRSKTWPSDQSLDSVFRLSERLILQVAQLWQRDLAKLETFSINVQRCSQNHAQNCIFGPRIARNISGLFESFNAKKLCSRVSSRECQFYS